MSTIRLLHTADWQIGKGFGRIPGDAGALLREQRFQTIRRIGERATEACVDAVLVAGDVFDAQGVSDQTLQRLADCLDSFRGDWVLLPGNHDAALTESVWTRLQKLGCLPGNVHLALRPEPLLLAGGRLAVLPAPLRRRHEPDDLTAWFDAADTPAGAVRVGLAHGSVDHRLPEGAIRHNLIADDRAERARLDYLALGDWHGTLEIAPRTWYAGTPETDSFRSQNPGHVLRVTFTEPGAAPRVEPVATTHFQWHDLIEQVHSQADLAALEDRLAALGPANRQVVRLHLQGTISLSDREALARLITRWEGRFRHLDCDTADIIPEPSAEDLATLGNGGFLGVAVAHLQALAETDAHPDQPYARDALQHLYREVRREEEGA